MALGGARIGGSTEGLYMGDEVRLTFVFRTEERVGYEGMVIHLQPAIDSFGVEFLSEPESIAIEDMNAERLRSLPDRCSNIRIPPAHTWGAVSGLNKAVPQLTESVSLVRSRYI